MLNRIDFSWINKTEGPGKVISVKIDGTDLVELVRGVEAASATAEGNPELAGSYVGLDERVADLHAHFLGRPDALYRHEKQTEILVCASCGEPGCWPLLVKIETEGDTIRWSSFRQPHRSDWDHSAMPRFVFDRNQYEAALRKLTLR